MELRNLSLVNWHLFPLIDIEVHGPVIGVVGPNKSGKSTILDALQTVLTGCDQQVMGLNRAAESGGRTGPRRTVQAYCLGRLGGDEDQTLRREAVTYLMLGFEDPKGIKKPVTLGLALEARISENVVNVVSRFIARGVLMKSADLLVQGPQGMIVEPWAECARRIASAVSAAGGELTEHRATAKEFVREYMHVLFPRGRTVAQVQYVKNLINAITFREMNSANEFIREYFLERDPIQVKALRDSIKVYRDAAAAVDGLTTKLKLLKDLRVTVSKIVVEMETEARERWLFSRATFVDAIQQRNRTRRSIVAKNKQIEANDRELQQCKAEIQRITDELRELQRQRDALLEVGTQRLLSSQMEVKRSDLRDIVRPISGPDSLAAIARQLFQFFRSGRYGQEIVGVFDRLAAMLPLTIDDPFRGSPQDIEDTVSLALSHLTVVAERMNTELRSFLAQRTALEQESGQLGDLLSASEKGRFLYSNSVQQYLNALQDEGIAFKVLCDHVEIADTSWAHAAEGFLGPHREAVFVAPGDARRAFDILKNDRRDFDNVKVVNTRKMDRFTERPRSGTLASVFRTSDPLVMAYLTFRTGRVNLASSIADLDKDGRWIMQDGRFDDGASVEMKRPKDGLKIGAAARAAAAAAALARRSEIQPLLAAVNTEMSILGTSTFTVARLSDWITKHISSDTTLTDFLTKARDGAERLLSEIADMDARIRALRSVDTSDLDVEIAALKRVETDSRAESEKLTEVLTVLRYELRDLKSRLDGGSEMVGSEWSAKNAVTTWKRVRPAAIGHDWMETYAIRRRNKRTHAGVAKEAKERVEESTEQLNLLREEGAEQAREVLNLFGASDLFPSRLREHLVSSVKPWMDEQIEEIENETLVLYQKDLREARDKTEDIFRNSFVNELSGKFSRVQNELEEIRRVLRANSFLGERYNFKANAAPEYHAFHDIVRHQQELEATNVPLFRGAVADGPLAAQLNIVQNVLLAEDVDIEAYEDYRRYFTFEIEITDEASGRVIPWNHRKATASGGELQAPYYVALLSALSSIYYGGASSRLRDDEGGLCLAIFDEAFSKMDEKVRLKMVEFCSQLGLQLVLCGPDGGRQSMERYAHTLVDVWRSGDQSYAMPDFIKERTRVELAEIDPTSLTRDELERRMAAE